MRNSLEVEDPEPGYRNGLMLHPWPLPFPSKQNMTRANAECRAYEPRIRRCHIWCVIFGLLAAPISASAKENYRLDWEWPIRILELPRQAPLPNRVNIYLTGPGKYIDQADTPNRLATKPPAISLTNATDIDELMSLLQIHDNKARITNAPTRMGYTYHLLMYYESSKTLMHFRVFETSEFVTPWRVVYPRHRSGFLYFNDKVGPWLNARIKLPTNSPPAKPLKDRSD
jgi:hypothetical protein